MARIVSRGAVPVIMNARWTTTSAPAKACSSAAGSRTSPRRYVIFVQPCSSGSKGRRAMPTIRPTPASSWSIGTRPKPKVPVGPVTATVRGAERAPTPRRYPGAAVPRRPPGSSRPRLSRCRDRGRMSKHLLNYAGAGAAAVVLAVAASAAGSSKDASTSAASAGGRAPMTGQAVPGGRQAPPGAAGMGTAVTGTAAAKARAAAIAKHPGTVEAVMRLADGSYVVHVITTSGELHVAVSKDFRVTGSAEGPGAPPSSTTSLGE